MKCAPPTASWDSFHVAIKGSFSTYQDANSKLNAAQYTSDINSASDTGCQKRTPVPLRHFDDYAEVPALGSQTRRKRKRIESFDSDTDVDDVDTLPSPPPFPTPFPERGNNNFASHHTSPTGSIVQSGSVNSDLNHCGQDEPETHDNSGQAFQDIRVDLLAGEGSLPQSRKQKVVPHEEFQRQAMRLLHMMRLTQLQHGEVLEELCSRHTRILEHCPSMIQAPFTTTEDLEAFDSTLNESKTAQLIDELCRLGGNDVGHATRNILCYILTDSLAEQYSWIGQKGKRKFAVLKFPSIIFRAVRANTKTTTANKVEVETHIKAWLRHAKDREKKLASVTVE
ncbi:uncharacterized protein LOC135383181 [Ornithodoros turicata]|uniref:uncharacterized protein LOC135383181 n=1 Tax=Ornithodoros turicata TaxID=34597 RepID=UPI003138FA17